MFWCAQDSASPGSLPLCIMDARCKKVSVCVHLFPFMLSLNVQASIGYMRDERRAPWRIAASVLSVCVCVRVRWLSVRSDCIDCIRTLAYYNLKSGSKVQSSPRISDVACWRMFKNLRNAWKLLTDLPFVIVWKPSLLPLFNFGFCKASSRMGKTTP